jgi:Tol biopolymer transport system component/C-terminal processing protease CtpA/Prc
MKKLLVLPLLLLTSMLFAQSDTALWLRHPAISPDGKTIAFGYMGDIYTVPYEGGEARPLTMNEAYESQPVWSPNSKQIAFASGRYGNDDIFVMPAQGGAATRLTEHSASDEPYSFSPDGSSVLFGSVRLDHHASVLFPTWVLPELYEVPVGGGRVRQILTTPAIDARYSEGRKHLLYHDQKGYEDPYRKHQTSSVARDIWHYNSADSTHTQLTTHPAEDRTPLYAAVVARFYFLSERSGSFNVWKADLDKPESNVRQVSFFDTHPVRSLSMSNESVLCYTYAGEIYTQLEADQPRKVRIIIRPDRRYNTTEVQKIDGEAGDYAVSPNGKEIAFIVRGEVFVTSTEFGSTKRITNTPEQERDLDWYHDGSRLLYSGERNGSWNIYEATLNRPEEKYFYNATLIDEKPVVLTDNETFQGRYSPDGKEVAFLEERTTLRVKNMDSGAIRTVMPGSYNYSYSDGDQYYTWSPDSQWLLVSFFDNERWNGQVGLVKASGAEAPVNLTRSGYGCDNPKFAMNGNAILYESDKDGYRSHGSWGAQGDVYAYFLNEDAYQRFKLSKADYALWKELKESEKKIEDADEKDDKKKKNKDAAAKKEAAKPLNIEWEELEYRHEKLTEFSAFVADYLLDSLGEKLYYLSRTDKGYNLWKTDFKEGKTEQLATLNGSPSSLYFDKDETHIILNNDGALSTIAVADGKQEGIKYSGEMLLNADAERAYMYAHAWRQTKKKFYQEDMHGVDWEMYRDHYAQFLPHINNGFDFANLLSELLGELNASHTGGRYRERDAMGDQTAALGAYFDESHPGDGLLIAAMMPRSPMLDKEGMVKPGVVIEKINGVAITAGMNYYSLLNRKAGDKVLLSYRGPSGKKWDAGVEPISLGAENGLAYLRWIAAREADVDRLSNGKIGYVHVKGMNSESFREVYSRALGRHNTKDALVVDTRFNGGGWLHDDLATFLSGEPYMQFLPRGQGNMGGEPLGKWQKPSAVLMSEGNYSDAHLFPYVYKFFDIGPLVGMPVPGTGTAVWWEQMLDGTVFGIPELGMRDVRTGELMENTQLEPDHKVPLEAKAAAEGRDLQLEKAVEVLSKP